ncbi:MAG: SurA N-terminal domain-containing protein [Coriobacteriales bacterium]
MTARHRIACLPAIASCLAALAVAAACLSGCLGLSKKVTVAATVGDIVISEEDVTEYIEGFRSQDEDRATDAGWAQYLASNGYTAESFRLKVLNDVFIPAACVRVQAAAHNVVVTDEELDQVIAAEKAFYEESYGADTWTSVLASFGYDEQTWRDSEMERLLEERLSDKVLGTVEPSQKQLFDYAPSIAPRFNGKHSYYIAFDSSDAAESALASLGGAGASIKQSMFRKVGELYSALPALQGAQEEQDQQQGEEESSPYAQANGMQDAGWGSLTNTPQNSNNTYTNALNKLDVGTVSEVVEPETGHWVLIFCDEAYLFQENDLYDVDAIPSDIRDAIVSAVADQLRKDSFDAWLKDAMEDVDIVVNDMPSGLSYDVNNQMTH